MNKLVTEVKENNQDFEFYPTTNEIISSLINDLKESNKHYSFLDIGSGNGKVLSKIAEEFHSEVYAIEKSSILRNNLDKSIYIIGTDFYQQSLIDKNIDITFSNPPYSEYEQWTKKIIRESSSKYIYLVLPERWINSVEIKQAIEYRNTEYRIVGKFDFLNSEDRQARAVVNLICIDLNKCDDDSFDRLFNEEFKSLKEKFEENGKIKEKKEEEKFSSLVVGSNYVKSVVEMYNQEIINIKNNYDSIGKLDIELLKEFDIEIPKILKLLKERLAGLKNRYWNEIISRMNELTSRLTTKNRNSLLKKLQENGHVDFTEENIYSTIVWILKNANSYIDSQLIEVYEKMINKANVKNYKSNTNVYEYDRWRYNEEKPSHISLEYRLVLEYCGRVEKKWSNKYTLNESGCDFIRDLLTIANNLGFQANTVDNRLANWSNEWVPGHTEEFLTNSGDVLFEVKGHKNGNLHMRMNQKFALALNVEYGRLKGWIHSKDQANYELDDNKAEEVFKTNYTIFENKIPLLADYH
jgi:hypothetical protein